MVSLRLVKALLVELVDAGNGFCRLAEYISTQRIHPSSRTLTSNGGFLPFSGFTFASITAAIHLKPQSECSGNICTSIKTQRSIFPRTVYLNFSVSTNCTGTLGGVLIFQDVERSPVPLKSAEVEDIQNTSVILLASPCEAAFYLPTTASLQWICGYCCRSLNEMELKSLEGSCSSGKGLSRGSFLSPAKLNFFSESWDFILKK